MVSHPACFQLGYDRFASEAEHMAATKNPVEKLKGEMVTKSIDELQLDPQNPRLPEELLGEPQEKLLGYLYNNGVLEELAQSFVDNGFFVHEPLIITRAAKGRYVVLEGNRRLAALMILRSQPEAEGLDLGVRASRQQLAALADIPCFEVKDRNEVYRFLGFRHIGGIKKWGAEAKARYIEAEVDRAIERGSEQPFRDVGKRVGSNALGVRNSYIALAILRHAQEEFGIAARELRNNRFGVWTRALNSPEIREYIGWDEVVEYEDVERNLKHLRRENLARVIADLTPLAPGAKALVDDSRKITDYGRILANKRASSMLIKYRDFDAAKRVVDELDLPTRLRKIKNDCDIALQEVQAATPSEELLAAATELSNSARAIAGTVREALVEK
jgi:ParB-like nuclease family protein